MEPWISITLLVLIAIFVVAMIIGLSKGISFPYFDDPVAKLFVGVISLLTAFMLFLFFFVK